ncbi:MAG: SH3 domain-containing protein [Sphingomonadales bacterium]
MTSDNWSPDNPSSKPRKVIHLIGPSVPVDPTLYAVRRDLAELALADVVFAQHYAVPMPTRTNREVAIHAGPRADSDVVATLAVDSVFSILDIGKDWAWGRGEDVGSVGYVIADALTLP